MHSALAAASVHELIQLVKANSQRLNFSSFVGGSSVHPIGEMFRAAVTRISNVLAVEISKNFSLSEIKVETPLETTKGFRLKQDVILVPVLRAGLGMMEGGFSRIFSVPLSEGNQALLRFCHLASSGKNSRHVDFVLTFYTLTLTV